MKGYFDFFLKYGYTKPMHPKPIPHKHREIKYEAKQQLIPAYDTIPALDATGVKRIQAIIVALLYYARTINNKILVSLSAAGALQAAANEDTSGAIKQILDYVATYTNGGIFYLAIKMILADHSDSGFHNESKGRSRSGAHIVLSENDPEPRCNGSIFTISQIFKFFMTSAAEA